MVQPLLVFAGRAALGVFLAIVLGIVGIGVAWILYIFIATGVADQTTLLSLLMLGAGIGAGLGGFFAWLRLDGDRWPIVVATLVLALLAGGIGAWAGYEFGGSREVVCCAEPTVKPPTYMAVGAAVVANGTALAANLVRSATLRRRHTRAGSLH